MLALNIILDVMNTLILVSIYPPLKYFIVRKNEDQIYILNRIKN
jgi:hypothetical protein